MRGTSIPLRCAACLLLIGAVLLASCSRPRPRVERYSVNPSPSKARVGVSDALLLSNAERSSVEVTLTNNTNGELWVRFELDSPRAENDCAVVRRIAPKTLTGASCPQLGSLDGAAYMVEITVYADQGQRKILEKTMRSLHFDADGRGSLKAL